MLVGFVNLLIYPNNAAIQRYLPLSLASHREVQSTGRIWRLESPRDRPKIDMPVRRVSCTHPVVLPWAAPAEVSGLPTSRGILCL